MFSYTMTFETYTMIILLIDMSTTSCPKNAVLFKVNKWDACMVWKLLPLEKGKYVDDLGTKNTKNIPGEIVLQNSVSSQDCNEEKLQRWNQYITKIWKRPGIAQCCFEVS